MFVKPGVQVALWIVLLSTAGLSAAGRDLRLVDAVRNRNFESARALITQRVDVNAPQPDGATALHWAAHWDDVEAAELLIKAGAKANATNDYGITPLLLACTNGSAAVVEKLLTAGADPNLASPSGETPLMTCARTGKVDPVKALMARGADVNARETTRGQTALMWAASEGHLAVVRALVEGGAAPAAQSNNGFSPLLFAARQGDIETTRFLLDRGVDVNAPAKDGSTALLVATVRGHSALGQFLLDKSADPNAIGAGYTPLHWASGKWETLLTSGSTGLKAESGEWSRLLGVQEGRLDLIKALLAHGAKPNLPTKKVPPKTGFSFSQIPRPRLIGATAFTVAAAAADVPTMRVLLAGGADPKVPMADGTTPLILAAGWGRIPGETRITEESALEAVTFLLELGADVNAANDDGNTALHGAASLGLDTVARLLIDKGADVNARNNVDGRTPVGIAEDNDPVSPSTAKLIRAAGGDR